MDAVDEVAQVLDRRRASAAARRRARRAARVARGARARSSSPISTDEPLLRAVVQVAPDPPALGVRGDFLFKLGRLEEARGEFERAAALTRNARERDLLLERAATCLPGALPAL